MDLLLCTYLIGSLLLLHALLVTGTSDSHMFDNNTSALNIILHSKPSSIFVYTDNDNLTRGLSLLALKGYPKNVVYNRVPKSASTTLRYLFRDQAASRGFTIFNKEIYVPFLLSVDIQREVASELESAKAPALYERHMYFINFDDFQKPQPIYINVVRDPIQQVISAYYYSRETCINEQRCYFNTTFVNETLDECVRSRSASECVSASQGVSPILPFFCGNLVACEENKTFALQKAKQNIIDYYTVIGIVEELYNFLFVLEHIIPKYFANICQTYMSNGMRKENVRSKKTKNNEPSETTKTLLRAALADEYDLYEFIKRRFNIQFQQVLQYLAI
ncbi:unnamed protein product [Adineta steineri]|uniref:Uncharacterized protein n=1 Tax=Adineta steineri TaxID=433720 RepID=A0A819NUR7_9BILA|nr:unnamed protein product [Adineta steineri]